MTKDPKLLERRANAGPDAEQEKGQRITIHCVVAFCNLCSLRIDHRLMWSAVRVISVNRDGRLRSGFHGIFVFEENTFTRRHRSRLWTEGHIEYVGALDMLLGVALSPSAHGDFSQPFRLRS